MPACNAPLTFVIPGGLDPRWSLLGRALRRRTGDRLRAEALQITLLTGTALAWLMGVYAVEAAVVLSGLPSLALGIGLAGAALVGGGAGVLGFRPQAVVRAGPQAVTVERGDERLRLPYVSLEAVETVDARRYHRHERRCAAVRPFLGDATAPVLLLRAEGGETVAALGLRSEDREALQRYVQQQRDKPENETAQRPAMMAKTGS